MKQKIQRCEICDQPTGRCEDDALTACDGDDGHTVILCEECFDAAASEHNRRAREYDAQPPMLGRRLAVPGEGAEETMSIELIIKCDRCNRELNAPTLDQSPAEEWAMEQGWIFLPNVDLCPICIARQAMAASTAQPRPLPDH